MAFIDFTNGEVLTADQMDTVMRQSVMRFADASARDTALSAVLAEGLMCYLDDTNEVLKYDGSSWIDISGDITGVTAGTALTGGGTSGNVTLDVDETALTIAQSQVTNLTTDLAGKQDDVITTQGDLVIGDGSGDASRLGIGAADTVLTSNGTTAVWLPSGGGGAHALFELSYNALNTITVDFPSNSVVRFAVVTTTDDPFQVKLLDSSDNVVDTVTVDRNNPFSYFTNATAITKLEILQNVIDENVLLMFTNPDAAASPTSTLDVLTITSTQSVTLSKTFTAYCFGGGGGGGALFDASQGSGGGGGSGFFATGNVTAGTYTATIGSGGSGGVGADNLPGGTGGTTSIDTVSASGGNGGANGDVFNGGDGGSGGSGGGGGSAASPGGTTVNGGTGGTDGASGQNGLGNQNIGSGGSGSGTSLPAAVTSIEPLGAGGTSNSDNTQTPAGFYGGGAGGAISANNTQGSSSSSFAAGGNGTISDSSPVRQNGGSGGPGFIILVEA